MFADSFYYSLTEVAKIESTTLEDFHCFFDFIYNVSYTPTEISAIKSFVQDTAAEFLVLSDNTRKSSIPVRDLMKALGLADVQFETRSFRSGMFTSKADDTSGINDLDITQGVAEIKLVDWTPLKVDPAIKNNAVLADPETGKIAMMDQKCGLGRVMVLGCPEVFRMDLLDKNRGFIYNLVHKAKKTVDWHGTQTSITTSATTLSTVTTTTLSSITSTTQTLTSTHTTTTTVTSTTPTITSPTTTHTIRRGAV